MNKRGISAVVAMALLVLLVIGSVALLWLFIRPTIIESGDSIGTEQFLMNLQIEDVEFRNLNDGEREVDVKVNRGAGGGELSSLKIFVSYGDETETFSFGEGIAELETKRFSFNPGNNIVRSVSIAPVFISSSGGESVGSRADEASLTDDEIIEQVLSITSNLDAVAWWRFEGNAKDEYKAHDGTLKGSGELVLNGDAEMGDTTNFEGSSYSFTGVTDEDSNAGMYSFYKDGAYSDIHSSEFIPIDLAKEYNLSGAFRKYGSSESKVYFGYVLFDENKQRIYHHEINAMSGTETELYADVSSEDTIVKIVDGANWGAGTGNMTWHSVVAFDIDDSGNYDDLPNRDISNFLGSQHVCEPTVEQRESYWEIMLCGEQTVGKDYSAGTKIRKHISGGTYMYTAVVGQNIPDVWTEYSSVSSGESVVGPSQSEFWRGTKFVKILLLPNYWGDSNSKIRVDDISLTTVPITYTGPESTEGRFGRAYDFDGIDDYVHLGEVLPTDKESNFTISAWARADSSSPVYKTIIGTDISHAELMMQSDTNIFFGMNGGGGWWEDAGEFSIGDWHHVVGVYDGGEASIYVDGVLKSGPTTRSFANNHGVSLVGKYKIDGDEFFNGAIDEVMIFDKALTSNEVETLYNLDLG